MSDRWQISLKYATYALAALLLLELVLGILHCLPFAGVTIPRVPTLDNPAPAPVNHLPQSPSPTAIVPSVPTPQPHVAPSLPAQPPSSPRLPTLWDRVTTFFQKVLHLPSKGQPTPSPTAATNQSSPRPDVAKAPPTLMKPSLPPTPEKQIEEAITNSEILGPVVHPLPMALLGIAGDQAILRTDSGEIGLAKEGGSVGEIHLLRIGINRVLIELNGQKRELLMFDGYGGESLLPKEPQSPNENK